MTIACICALSNSINSDNKKVKNLLV